MNSDWGEQLVLCSSLETGLRAVIAIDSTVLGPAVGGTRIRAYASDTDAIADARRLASAMTVKAALAGLPIGGGKAVIIADPDVDKTESLLRTYGRFLQTLGGRFVAAQDVGTSPADLDIVGRETPYVVGRSERFGGGGDPSDFTARGVFQAMRAVTRHRHGSGLAGRRVVVLGVGGVGGALVNLLTKAGADVLIADVSETRLDRIVERHGVTAVPWETAHTVSCDVFAPCALGGVLTPTSIGQLDCWAVVGAANNQLVDAEDAGLLANRGIDYVPDFLASAGGLIAGTTELLHPPFRRDHALAAIDEIYQRTLLVLRRAESDDVNPLVAANTLAQDRLRAARCVPTLSSAR